MKRISSNYTAFIVSAIFLFGLLSTKCERTKLNMPLVIYDTISFTGSFKTINGDNIKGTVSLSLFKNSYFCATNLPYGHGAGRVQIENTTIDFIDTLFFPIPAIYGPSYVLSGKHEYSFDGENLKIWKNKNQGSIEYYLRN